MVDDRQSLYLIWQSGMAHNILHGDAHTGKETQKRVRQKSDLLFGKC